MVGKYVVGLLIKRNKDTGLNWIPSILLTFQSRKNCNLRKEEKKEVFPDDGDGYSSKGSATSQRGSGSID